MTHIYYGFFNKSPNLGLYGIATKTYCLLGTQVSEETKKEIEAALGVPVVSTTIVGSTLVGIFCAGNSKSLLVPHIAYDRELEALKKSGIPFKVIQTDLTALGNNIIVNDSGGIFNPEFEKDVQESIRNALGVPMEEGTVANLPTVGSLGAANNSGCLVHNDILPAELKKLKRILKVGCNPGTLNLGSPYIRSAAIVNDNGIAIGKSSTGYEVNEAEMTFGFLGQEIAPRISSQ